MRMGVTGMGAECAHVHGCVRHVGLCVLMCMGVTGIGAECAGWQVRVGMA